MSDEEILFQEDGRCGVITLNRPSKLNAQTLGMIRAFKGQYEKWANDPDIYGCILQAAGDRAFCAGGDVRTIYEWGREGRPEAVGYYAEEYWNNWALDRFPKPNVPLINGVVMGGGVGITLYGTHRVAGEKFSLAMPEVGIGLFPDIGGTYFLPRLRGKTGTYLALTGASIGRADAYSLGLVTHCITSDKYPQIHEAMREAEPVDTVLDGLHEDPGAGDLAERQEAIDRLFGGGSVEEILDTLDAETGELADWAHAQAAEIRKKSPTSLKVAMRQIQIGPEMELRDALQLEYRLVARFMAGSEFYEGVRAVMIDKDQSPRWQPATLGEVTEAMIDDLFAPMEGQELELPTLDEEALPV